MNTREIKLLMAARDVLEQDPAHIDTADLEQAVALFENEAAATIAPVKVIFKGETHGEVELGPFGQGVVLTGNPPELHDVASDNLIAWRTQLGKWGVMRPAKGQAAANYFEQLFVQPA